MKIIIMGTSGIIGREIVRAMSPQHDIVQVSRNGDVQVDYTDTQSVQDMFEAVGAFDALVVAVGNDSLFKVYEDLADDDFVYGFQRKFLAQINLVRTGTPYARDGASFTLSSGYLSDYPNPASAATGPFNAAVDSFVRTVGPLLPRRIRLNVVSPAPVVSSDQVGRGTITAAQAAAGYIQSIEGTMNGEILRLWGGLENEPRP
ncbi:MAG: short chain dehydrogenase [Nitrospirales bacterium]|nr:short chain dehydrogenase [Nitrospirales bacterium]